MNLRVGAVAALLIGSAFAVPAARAEIYSYTGDDGEVYLSNVPVDERYTLLVGTPAPVAAPPSAVPTARAPQTAARGHFGAMVEEAARANNLDSALLRAVITVESHYNPKAVSKKGAMGLMQLMPDTAKRYGVVDAFDPRQNVHAGARYLSDLLRLFNSDMRLALAAYNAGENAVIRSGNQVPRIRETLDYVPKVLSLYQKYQVSL